MEKIVSDIREHFQKLYQLAANCLNVLFVAVSLHYFCDRWSQTLKKELCNVGSFLNYLFHLERKLSPFYTPHLLYFSASRCEIENHLLSSVCVRWEGDVVSAKRQMSTSCEGDGDQIIILTPVDRLPCVPCQCGASLHRHRRLAAAVFLAADWFRVDQC
ncbi:hypothetical protein T02_13815 [Trichinella nativa]|uniref:Uncharacterized protein n=1 Tax=Trichinella nativa TaxID=6335 RepID=A0A0V1LTB8_9BILA|nr:hypothetical protein T02_13815 [Trichinella nativa]